MVHCHHVQKNGRDSEKHDGKEAQEKSTPVATDTTKFAQAPTATSAFHFVRPFQPGSTLGLALNAADKQYTNEPKEESQCRKYDHQSSNRWKVARCRLGDFHVGHGPTFGQDDWYRRRVLQQCLVEEVSQKCVDRLLDFRKYIRDAGLNVVDLRNNGDLKTGNLCAGFGQGINDGVNLRCSLRCNIKVGAGVRKSSCIDQSFILDRRRDIRTPFIDGIGQISYGVVDGDGVSGHVRDEVERQSNDGGKGVDDNVEDDCH
mmetsp:Transcript_45531/g.67107  ORF Transcript_45531/g.67107 Transcript_45531/m.67107 type:complete len:259 (-) Transcript_45531:581-1357(-)